MDGKRQMSYVRTGSKARQRKRYQIQRYRRQKLFLCLALLFFIVLAIRCLTRLYVLEDQVFGVEQKVQAADTAVGGVLDGQGHADGQNITAGHNNGHNGADGIIELAAKDTEQLSGGLEQAGNSGAAQLSENEIQEWKAIYGRNKELLILVNKEHSISREQEPAMRTICNGRLSSADCLYNDLTEMLSDAKKAGYEYWIASAYRSAERQQKLVDEDVRKFLAKGYAYEKALEKTYDYMMPAGYSEHQTGLALDILCSGNINMDDSQEEEPGNKWMKEHCQEYGFILRYPREKEGITGIRYEPWHFRYVGKEAAAWLTERNLTLEDVLPL